jgi:purine-binding chemotaxis protein CheW
MIHDQIFEDSVQESDRNQINVDPGWGLFDTEATKQAHVVQKASDTSIKNPAPLQDRVGASKAPNIEQPVQDDQKIIEAKDTYLLCHQGKTTFALPVRFVQEIMPNRELKPLPISRKKVAGVISFRGQIMPVLDIISGDENLKQPTQEKSGCIIVCQVGKKLFGFRIEQVSTVIEVQDSQLQAVHTKLDSSEKRLVSHLSHIDGKAISFLDLSGVISA